MSSPSIFVQGLKDLENQNKRKSERYDIEVPLEPFTYRHMGEIIQKEMLHFKKFNKPDLLLERTNVYAFCEAISTENMQQIEELYHNDSKKAFLLTLTNSITREWEAYKKAILVAWRGMPEEELYLILHRIVFADIFTNKAWTFVEGKSGSADVSQIYEQYPYLASFSNPRMDRRLPLPIVRNLTSVPLKHRTILDNTNALDLVKIVSEIKYVTASDEERLTLMSKKLTIFEILFNWEDVTIKERIKAIKLRPLKERFEGQEPVQPLNPEIVNSFFSKLLDAIVVELRQSSDYCGTLRLLLTEGNENACYKITSFYCLHQLVHEGIEESTPGELKPANTSFLSGIKHLFILPTQMRVEQSFLDRVFTEVFNSKNFIADSDVWRGAYLNKIETLSRKKYDVDINQNPINLLLEWLNGMTFADVIEQKSVNEEILELSTRELECKDAKMFLEMIKKVIKPMTAKLIGASIGYPSLSKTIEVSSEKIFKKIKEEDRITVSELVVLVKKLKLISMFLSIRGIRVV